MAVEFGIITSVVCPGGWHYPQSLTSGQSIKITGFSFEELINNMLEFRRRHPELVGGNATATIEKVRIDLKNYLCTHFRQNCADAPSNPNIQPLANAQRFRTDYSRPIDRASDWLASVTAAKIERVDAALAAARAQICATCPMNIRWMSPCAPCNDSVQIRIQNAKGSAHTPYDRHLFVCRAYGHVNEVAVWLANTMSETKQQIPVNCWLAPK